MNSFKLNRDKAVNSLLYVVSRLDKADKHKTFKILYFADMKHIKEYGRPINGDTYIKMDYGPVPSFIKNIVEEEIKGLEEVVSVYNKIFIQLVQQPNLDFLSESDIECLDKSIDDNKELSFTALTDKSHDSAYHNASWQIDYLDMAKVAGADINTLTYIREQMINDSIFI